MSMTRAQKNRQIRQESIREQLATYGLIQQVLEISNKLLELEDMTSTHVAAMKSAADLKLRLVDKYLPSLQAIEVDQTINDKRNVISDKPITADEWADKYSLESPERTTESVN